MPNSNLRHIRQIFPFSALLGTFSLTHPIQMVINNRDTTICIILNTPIVSFEKQLEGWGGGAFQLLENSKPNEPK